MALAVGAVVAVAVGTVVAVAGAVVAVTVGTVVAVAVGTDEVLLLVGSTATGIAVTVVVGTGVGSVDPDDTTGTLGNWLPSTT